MSNQKEPELQTSLLGAGQGSVLQDFVNPILTLTCWAVVHFSPPPKTGSSEQKKLNESLSSGYKGSK